MALATDFTECAACHTRTIVPASGPALNYWPDPYGTVAASHLASGAWSARRLQQQEQPIPPEKRYSIHRCEGSGQS
jgi:mono/diheme cytochrome c family protein